MDKLMLQGGWQAGAETGASNGGVPLDLPGTCRPCHTPGRRRLQGPPAGEVNRQAARDIELVLGRPKS
eukprot:2971635-Prorocentrum_lima.AAC.1